MNCFVQRRFRALSPELVVSVEVPSSDTDQLVEVRGGGGDQVHPGAVDVHLIEDALPRDLSPQEATTLERELTSLISETRKIETLYLFRTLASHSFVFCEATDGSFKQVYYESLYI